MNQKTSKLLRRYARVSGEAYRSIKNKWDKEPAPRRGELRSQMQSHLWSTTCRDWRSKLNLIAKQAADKLGVPFDTYRDWEKGTTPHKIVRSVITQRMKEISNAEANPSLH